MVIAAKNADHAELAREMADLWFHTFVLLAQQGMQPGGRLGRATRPSTALSGGCCCAVELVLALEQLVHRRDRHFHLRFVRVARRQRLEQQPGRDDQSSCSALSGYLPPSRSSS